MARQRMSNMDSVFVHLEGPTNLMILGAPVDSARLGSTIDRRLIQFDRFRQRIVRSGLRRGNLYWEDDPGFDLAYHLRRVSLPPPGDRTALQEAVSVLASIPLDLSRPPRQFHLVERYDQGSAIICQLHHSLADGLALVQVLLALTDTEPVVVWSATLPSQKQHRARPKDKRPRVRRLIRSGWAC